MKKRYEVFNKFVEYYNEHGYPPTVRELCDLTNLKSTSSVHAHLLALRDENLLESDQKEGSGTARSLRPSFLYLTRNPVITRIPEDMKIPIPKFIIDRLSITPNDLYEIKIDKNKSNETIISIMIK